MKQNNMIHSFIGMYIKNRVLQLLQTVNRIEVDTMKWYFPMWSDRICIVRYSVHEIPVDYGCNIQKLFVFVFMVVISQGELRYGLNCLCS